MQEHGQVCQCHARKFRGSFHCGRAVRCSEKMPVQGIAAATILALCGTAPLWPSPQPPHGKSALVVRSYYKGLRWTHDEDRRHRFRSPAGIGSRQYLYRVYVCQALLPARFAGAVRGDLPPEVRVPSLRRDLVASGNYASDFLRQYRDQLFPGTPVVLCGVNYFKQGDLKGHRLFTGVSTEADIKDTLDLALRLHPAVRHIYVVNEATEAA